MTTTLRQTVVFPVRYLAEHGGRMQVLLARKTRKIGVGLWNGFGGNIKDGETIIDAACRELYEETGGLTSIGTAPAGQAGGQFGIRCEKGDLMTLAKVDIAILPKNLSLEVYFFSVQDFVGEAIATEEMSDPTWFFIEEIPYGEMLPADRLFLPNLFRGEILLGDVTLDQNPAGGDQMIVTRSNFTKASGISV